MKNIPENLMIVEYNDYGRPMVAMYNSTVISNDEVTHLVETSMLGFEYSAKVVVMTKAQYKNLFDHIDTFYADLALEQKETM
jgi:hypothetical protein